MFSQDMPSRTKCVNVQQDDWRFGAKTGAQMALHHSQTFLHTKELKQTQGEKSEMAGRRNE